jgi:hypothetical protein
VRKKIPTVTRPDPAYTASLRRGFEEGPEREAADRAVLAFEPSGPKMETAERTQGPAHSAPPFLAQQTSVKSGSEVATPSAVQCLQTKRLPATRKVDIRVNALERQEEALINCGVDPAHVIRAALRRAVKNWQLDPHFVAPSEEPRSRITEWRARTSLAVNTAALATLLRAHDPLDVMSKWALIRGQVEPRVWTEIDAVLAELYADDECSGTATVP